MSMTQAGILVLDLESDIADRFVNLCERRGVSHEKMLETMVRSFDRGPVLYTIHDRLDFGKYSGAYLEDIVRTDPRYIRWLTRESAWFRVDETSELLLREMEKA